MKSRGPKHCNAPILHNPQTNEKRKRIKKETGGGTGNKTALKVAFNLRSPLTMMMASKGPNKKKTSCWKGYSNIVNGKKTFKKKGKRMVPDCKPINKKK